MKGLKTLLKLHKNKIDDIILIINKLNNNKLALEEQIDTLKLTIAKEIEFINIPDYAIFLARYLQTAKQQQQQFMRQLNDVDTKLTQEYEHLSDEFSELKKVELLIKNKLAFQQATHNKKEEIVLNDNTLMKYNYDREL